MNTQSIIQQHISRTLSEYNLASHEFMIIYIYTYTHTYTYIYIYIHIHIHVHIYIYWAFIKGEVQCGRWVQWMGVVSYNKTAYNVM